MAHPKISFAYTSNNGLQMHFLLKTHKPFRASQETHLFKAIITSSKLMTMHSIISTRILRPSGFPPGSYVNFVDIYWKSLNEKYSDNLDPNLKKDLNLNKQFKPLQSY